MTVNASKVLRGYNTTVSPEDDMRRQGGRNRIGKVKRTKINKHFGGTCVYCGGHATQLDHFTPWSLSGDDSTANLLPACRTCNSLAASKVFESFDEKRAYVLNQLARRKNLEEVYCPKGCGVTYARRGEMDRCPDCGELL